MIASHLSAMLCLAAVLLLWAAVQQAWRRSFPEASSDADALAGRIGCNGCDRMEACARGAAGSPDEEEGR